MLSWVPQAPSSTPEEYAGKVGEAETLRYEAASSVAEQEDENRGEKGQVRLKQQNWFLFSLLQLPCTRSKRTKKARGEVVGASSQDGPTSKF